MPYFYTIYPTAWLVYPQLTLGTETLSLSSSYFFSFRGLGTRTTFLGATLPFVPTFAVADAVFIDTPKFTFSKSSFYAFITTVFHHGYGREINQVNL